MHRRFVELKIYYEQSQIYKAMLNNHHSSGKVKRVFVVRHIVSFGLAATKTLSKIEYENWHAVQMNVEDASGSQSRMSLQWVAAEYEKLKETNPNVYYYVVIFCEDGANPSVFEPHLLHSSLWSQPTGKRAEMEKCKAIFFKNY